MWQSINVKPLYVCKTSICTEINHNTTNWILKWLVNDHLRHFSWNKFHSLYVNTINIIVRDNKDKYSVQLFWVDLCVTGSDRGLHERKHEINGVKLCSTVCMWEWLSALHSRLKRREKMKMWATSSGVDLQEREAEAVKYDFLSLAGTYSCDSLLEKERKKKKKNQQSWKTRSAIDWNTRGMAPTASPSFQGRQGTCGSAPCCCWSMQ